MKTLYGFLCGEISLRYARLYQMRNQQSGRLAMIKCAEYDNELGIEWNYLIDA